MIASSYIASYPYSYVPTLMKRLEADGQLELLEAVRERYATMKPDQRIKVIHYENKSATGVEANKDASTTP